MFSPEILKKICEEPMKVVYLKRVFVQERAEKCQFIGFEVLTAVVMNRRIF
jgi:hypothetical protein